MGTISIGSIGGSKVVRSILTVGERAGAMPERVIISDAHPLALAGLKQRLRAHRIISSDDRLSSAGGPPGFPRCCLFSSVDNAGPMSRRDPPWGFDPLKKPAEGVRDTHRRPGITEHEFQRDGRADRGIAAGCYPLLLLHRSGLSGVGKLYRRQATRHASRCLGGSGIRNLLQPTGLLGSRGCRGSGSLAGRRRSALPSPGPGGGRKVLSLLARAPLW